MRQVGAPEIAAIRAKKREDLTLAETVFLQGLEIGELNRRVKELEEVIRLRELDIASVK